MDDQTNRRMEDGNACLDAALFYLSLGWSPLPLCPPDHVGMARVDKAHGKTCSHHGKRPWIAWKKFQDELPLEADVRYWWDVLPNGNVGMAYGPVSGLVGIDVDGPAGEKLLLEKSKGELPPTLEFSTPGGGRRLLYAIPMGASLRTTFTIAAKGEELRFQAKGAQTVMPPSRHANGGVYRWAEGRGPDSMRAAPAPPWLLRELAPSPGHPGKGKTAADLETLFSGVEEHAGRNVNMASIVGRLLCIVRDVDNANDLHTVWLSVQAINERNDPPLDDHELRTIFISILKREKLGRKEKDLEALDRIVSEQVDRSVGAATESPSHEGNGGNDQGLPDWHLVIVYSDPVEYRLRSPFWSDAPQLKDGYLVLTTDQILNWTARGDSVRKAALRQAQRIIPPVLKGWAAPGGQLERLIDAAKKVETPPESKRRLYILSFIYRYLTAAKPPKSNGDGKEHWSSVGNPTLCDDGSVAFKFPNLKRKVRDSKEDFTHRELTSLLEEAHADQCRISSSRWWKISSANLARIGFDTLEGEEVAIPLS